MKTPLEIAKLKGAGAWVDYRDQILVGAGQNRYVWRIERPLNKIQFIVFHHTVSTAYGNGQMEVDAIAQHHVKINGWGGIGYHIVISTEYVGDYAKVFYVGDISTVRAHSPNSRGANGVKAQEGNYRSIGVSMVGDFTKYKPDQRQLNSLNAICEHFLTLEPRLPLLDTWSKIVPHKSWDATSCPGDKWDYNSIKTFVRVTNDPMENEQLKAEIATLKAEDAVEDAEFTKQIQEAEKTIISLKTLKEENTKLRDLNVELTLRISDLESSIDAKIKKAVEDAVSQVSAAYDARLAEKEVEITGLNNAIAEFRKNQGASGVVMIPKETVTKIEQLALSKHSWKEKLFNIWKELSYVLLNNSIGILGAIGGIALAALEGWSGEWTAVSTIFGYAISKESFKQVMKMSITQGVVMAQAFIKEHNQEPK